MTHPQALKALTPGRVLLVNTVQFPNTLGLLLQVRRAKGSDGNTYCVLVICEEESESENSKPKETIQNEYPLPVLHRKLFYPVGTCGHKVLDLKSNDITEITKKTVKKPLDNIQRHWVQQQFIRKRY